MPVVQARSFLKAESPGPRRRLPAMQLVFPSCDDVTIAEHFGAMNALIMIDVKDGVEVARERRDMSEMPACGEGHHDKPVFVAEAIKDCDVLIAGGMGAPMVERAGAVGVEVVLTEVRSIDEALGMYVAGTLVHEAGRAHHN